MKKEWKYINNTNQMYQISNCGEIKSINYNKSGKPGLLTPCIGRNGNLRIGIRINGKCKNFRVDRLVLEYFSDDFNISDEIIHKDGDLANNRLDNLLKIPLDCNDWKDISGYEGLYQVSRSGVVRGINRYTNTGRIINGVEIKQNTNNSGYKTVTISKDGIPSTILVHRLVTEAFIPKPNTTQKYEVDHIDTNKFNNCVENLRWVTHSENKRNPLTIELNRKVNSGMLYVDGERTKAYDAIGIFKDGELIKEYINFSELERYIFKDLGFQTNRRNIKEKIKSGNPDSRGLTYSFINK